MRKDWKSILLKYLINIFLFSISFSFKVEAKEIILKVYVNTEDKGTYFLLLEGRDIFIKEDDFYSLGFNKEKIRAISTQRINGDEYLSLLSLIKKNINFKLEEKEASLYITAPPHLFPKQIISLLPRRAYKSIYSSNNYFLFNYFLNYEKIHNNSKFYSYKAFAETVARIYRLLIYSNFSYSYFKEADKNPKERFTRLYSRAILDFEKKMTRITLGDHYAPNGDLIGGINLSRNFSLRPYFIKSPLPSLYDTLQLPSKVSLYINNRIFKKFDLSPGKFEIKDIPVYSGSGNITLITKSKDKSSQISQKKFHFYYAPNLLNPGLSEFNYSLGYKRRRLGIESYVYRDIIFAGIHRLGITKTLTLGGNILVEKGFINLGPQFTYLLPKIGVIKLKFNYSKAKDQEKEGYSCNINYSYNSRKIGGSLNIRYQTKDYLNSSSKTSIKSRLYGGGSLWLSFGNKSCVMTRVSIDNKYNKETTVNSSIAYSIYGRGKSIRLTFNRSDRLNNYQIKSSESKVSLNINWSLGGRILTGYNSCYNLDEENNKHNSQDKYADNFYFQKGAPLGKGIYYNFNFKNIINNNYDPKKIPSDLNASFGYRGKRGIYAFAYSKNKLLEKYKYSMKGAISIMRGSILAFSRPISDSFALVNAPGIKGATIYTSGQVIGKTNRKGKLLVPELISNYDNRISIGIKGEELPFNCSIKEQIKYVHTPYRGAARINFEVATKKAYFGKIFILKEEKKIPVELTFLNINYLGEIIEVPVGKGGEYYFENILPGKYPASIFYKGKEYRFYLYIPHSEEVVVELGEINLTSLE